MIVKTKNTSNHYNHMNQLINTRLRVGCEGSLTQFWGAVAGGDCIGVVVSNGVGMCVGGGGAGNRGSAVMSGGGDACAGNGGAS